MGIKGRRKKLREREAQGGSSQSVVASSIADPELRALALEGQLPPGLIPADQMRLKKSELYALQDEDVLEAMREEHRQRKGKAPSAVKKANRGEKDEAAMALAATAAADEVFDDGAHDDESRLQARRQKQVTGPSFSHPAVGLDPRVAEALALAGFHGMTRVQERAVPLALQGYDILGQAKTGSGKTLAFAVPVVHSAMTTLATAPGTFMALGLSPTKELCAQIVSVFGEVTRHLAVASGGAKKTPVPVVELITGGTKLPEERRRLLACNIAIGTPGRVMDHVKHTSSWTLRTTLTHFVMDEADRLLADGFQRDLDIIIAALPAQRQTMLFSATNSKSVRELARLSLAATALFVSTRGDAPRTVAQLGERNDDGEERFDSAPPYADFSNVEDGVSPLAANVGTSDAVDEEAIPSALRQYCEVVPLHERLRTLYTFVKRVAKRRKAMVFCSTVASTQFHCMMMGAVGFHDHVLMLHGKMKHRQRLATFDAFQAWTSGVLFCTDVAARGLDIPRVDWILQFDPPMDPTEYVHRIGRTARAGAVGSALMYVTPEEQPFVTYLAKYGLRMDVLPHEAPPDIQLSLQRILERDSVVAQHAVAAFRAHVAAYQSHVLSSIFDVRRLQLEDLAISLGLTNVPSVTLPKSNQEEKRAEYVKGKLKSLQGRANAARSEYERLKTKPQWTETGDFVGMKAPPKAL